MSDIKAMRERAAELRADMSATRERAGAQKLAAQKSRSMNQLKYEQELVKTSDKLRHYMKPGGCAEAATAEPADGHPAAPGALLALTGPAGTAQQPHAGGGGAFTCPVCNRGFKKEQHLRAHSKGACGEKAAAMLSELAASQSAPSVGGSAANAAKALAHQAVASVEIVGARRGGQLSHAARYEPQQGIDLEDSGAYGCGGGGGGGGGGIQLETCGEGGRGGGGGGGGWGGGGGLQLEASDSLVPATATAGDDGGAPAAVAVTQSDGDVSAMRAKAAALRLELQVKDTRCPTRTNQHAGTLAQELG
jgi:hypothetical protein